MNGSVESDQAETREVLSAFGSGETGPQAELDLERIVWDVEYRNSVRHLFKTGR